MHKYLFVASVFVAVGCKSTSPSEAQVKDSSSFFGGAPRTLVVGGDAVVGELKASTDVVLYSFTPAKMGRYSIEVTGDALVHVDIADARMRPVYTGDEGEDTISPRVGLTMLRLLGEINEAPGTHFLWLKESRYAHGFGTGSYKIRVFAPADSTPRPLPPAGTLSQDESRVLVSSLSAVGVVPASTGLGTLDQGTRYTVSAITCWSVSTCNVAGYPTSLDQATADGKLSADDYTRLRRLVFAKGEPIGGLGQVGHTLRDIVCDGSIGGVTCAFSRVVATDGMR